MNRLVHHRLESMWGISQSKWLSRAWTYQECHFSRRRLFFTPHQLLFVCNSGRSYEIKRPHSTLALEQSVLEKRRASFLWDAILPPLVPTGAQMLSHEFIILRLAMQYLEAYSGRKLTFDADTLNAIAGALSSLRNTQSPLYHICGVPICFNPHWANRLSRHRVLRDAKGRF
jgi:hypothetical protein